jgi:sigma-B regulation protein RsbU (phosphoserine phosphatase)
MSELTEIRKYPPEERAQKLEEKLEIERSRIKDIATLGAVLTSILDLNQVLSALMEMSIEMVNAEVGAIILLEESKLVTKVFWGVGENTLDSIKTQDGKGIVEWTLESGQTLLINDAHINQSPLSVPTQPNIKCLVSTPISCRGETIGALVVINKREEENFSSEDCFNLEMLVDFAAVAIENSRLLKESLEKQKLESQLKIAEEVQKTLLPNQEISLKGAKVDSLYIPAYHIGGDYFDIIPQSEDKFVMVIGDVSDKGIPAALLMAAVRSLVRAEAQSESPVKEIITRINRLICKDVVKYKDMFVTLFYGRFDIKTKSLVYSNAGHLPPIWVKSKSNSLEQLTGGGVILGQFEDFKYKEGEIHFNSNDIFIFYTDGVTECANAQGEMFGRDRLIQLAREEKKGGYDNFLRVLEKRIKEFCGMSSEMDDLTIVSVKIK